ncbi:hypothetical protein, partial [Sagittula sp.]|uniref:hypothetical protein n=1 Tax=Sagittula sp. TaxID=2038081 RepID=UPI003519D1E8
CRHPCFLFLDHPDDLRLGETALSHVSAPSELAQTLHYGEGFRGGQVTLCIPPTNSAGADVLAKLKFERRRMPAIETS